MIEAITGVQKLVEHNLFNTAEQLAITIADLAQGIDEGNEWLELQNG
jgi:hypothetical protein